MRKGEGGKADFQAWDSRSSLRTPHCAFPEGAATMSTRPTRMVDVSEKDRTLRAAKARGFVALQPGTVERIRSGGLPKGDVIEVARVAGIMAAKRTSELIPLCHPLPLTQVTVDFEPSRDPSGIRVEARAKVDAKTGVEMEALTAVSVACLTIYDMCKAVDRAMSFSNIRLIEKTGGRSGDFRNR